MAKDCVSKYDYKEMCAEKGILFQKKEGTYLYGKDKKGFTHKMDVASIRRGASFGIMSVIQEQKSKYFIDGLEGRSVCDLSNLSFGKLEYVSMLKGVVVTCNRHGDFLVKPSNLVKSMFPCKVCLRENAREIHTFKQDDFIRKAKEVHGDRYDYSKTVFKGIKGYVTVTCREHGDFEVLARTHSSGAQACGCAKCKTHGGGGYSRGEYLSLCPNGSSIYVLSMSSSDERYIKIGISKDVRKRSVTIGRVSGCSVEIVHEEFFADASVAWDVESLLHKEFSEYRYNPKVKYKGSTECFKGLDPQEVIKLLSCIA